MTKTEQAIEAVEWPDSIWAEERLDGMMGLYRLSAEATVGEELEHAEYVHRGVFDSLRKYHEVKVAELRAALDAAEARERQAVEALRERCAVICHQQAAIFGSVEYATDQPLSSFKERFACESCAAAIRTGAKP